VTEAYTVITATDAQLSVVIIALKGKDLSVVNLLKAELAIECLTSALMRQI